MNENEIAKIVVDLCYKIHKQYGPGLFESVYENIFCYELSKLGISYAKQQPIHLVHENVNMGVGFRADVIIENKVITELKSIALLAPTHFKQILTPLRLCKLKLGMHVNFNVALIKDDIQRMVNNL